MLSAEAGLFRRQGLTESLGIYLPATAAYRLVGLGRVILLIWFMGRGQFGLLSLALVVINVLTPLCSLGLNEAISRYVPHYEARGDLRRFVVSAGGAVALVGAALAGVAWLLAPLLAWPLLAGAAVVAGGAQLEPAGLVQLLRLSAAATLSLVGYHLVGAVLRGLRMFRALAAMELASGLLFAGLAAVAVAAGRGTAGVIIICYLISVVMPTMVFGAALMVGLPASRRDRPRQGESPAWCRLFSYGPWIALATVMWQVLQHYPMWFLNKVHGPEATAVFAAARQLAQLVLIGAAAATTVIAAAVTRTWESDGPAAAERQLSLAFKALGLVLVVVCALMGMARNWLIAIFRPDYADAAGALPALLGMCLLLGLMGTLTVRFSLAEQTRPIFAVYSIGVAANVVLGLWLIGGVAGARLGESFDPAIGSDWPSQALAAAAWTGLLATAVATASCLALLRRAGREPDIGSHVVLGGVALLVVPWPFMLIGLTGLVLLACKSSIIFSCADKRRLGQQLGGLARSLGLARR